MKRVRRVDLSKLPTKSNGNIDWKNSIGFEIPFYYDGVEGHVVIEGIDGKMLTLSYNDEIKHVSSKENLKKCSFGKMLGKITESFKIEIGQVFKNNKRDLTVTSCEKRKDKSGRNRKFYKYTCSKCGWTEGWMEEGKLLSGTNCTCCTNKVPVLGINTIWDTDRYLVSEYGLDEGFSKTHTRGTKKEGTFKCRDCGKTKKFRPYNVIIDKTIGCTNCGDGVSYPEKFMMSVLNQLELDFQSQLTNKNFEWCDKYKYDFYIPSLNMVIETHGIQHYIEKSKKSKFKLTLKEQQEIDKTKEQLALNNGVENYIVIDCRKSEIEWIKNSILNSKLGIFLKLDKIDWNKCGEFALKNLIKEVCEYWDKHPYEKTLKEIGRIFGIHEITVKKYLLKGKEIGMCSFDKDENRRLSRIRNMKKVHDNFIKKQIEVFKDGISLGVFESLDDLEKRSLSDLKVQLYKSSISAVCTGRYKQYKGFTFKYIEFGGDILNEPI